MSQSQRHFAIFGDIHGHLRLMFQLCRHWQTHNGVRLDGALICGDLGFFPDLGRMDKATRKYVDRDPEEAGIAYYFRLPTPPKRDPQLEQTLLGDPADLNTVDCPVIFCHGNHEDFLELERVTCGSALAPVDAFGRVHLLRSGEVTDLCGLRIAALGGGPERGGADAPVLGAVVSGRAANRVQRQSFDLLLSHVAPHVAEPRGGSPTVTEVISRSQPVYSFYAHHTHFIPPTTIGRTRCYYHADVNFQKISGQYQGPPESGCMAVLRWAGPDDHDYSVVDDPWFHAITLNTWRHF